MLATLSSNLILLYHCRASRGEQESEESARCSHSEKEMRCPIKVAAQRNANVTLATGCNNRIRQIPNVAHTSALPAEPSSLLHTHTHRPKAVLCSLCPSLLPSAISISVARLFLPYIINIIVVNVMRRDYDISLPCTRTLCQKVTRGVQGGTLGVYSRVHQLPHTTLVWPTTTAIAANLFTIAMAKCCSSYANALLVSLKRSSFFSFRKYKPENRLKITYSHIFCSVLCEE